MLTGSEIRRKFLDFFIQKQHREVHSSSLVPANDPTLLFTNAGMNQFKDVFLGLEKRDYARATTSQKCVRAGGKHNDLENVGFTNRHHTFFEMLGNFSFGDYFKETAIPYAWELVTSENWLGMDPDKLYVTIFEGDPMAHGIPGGIPPDEEAERLWLAVGVPKARIFKMGMADNFWRMGDTGPCGPCSEIHYDMGVAASDKLLPNCAAGKCHFPCPCGRYVEIWNLVFMQYDRHPRPEVPEMVEYKPLPKPSIDTGMGLERVAAVLQGVISNYDTDLFTPLISRASQLTGIEYQGGKARTDASLRIIADHARAATFLISDGVTPSRDRRGYVLRKILRRAMRHGRFLRMPHDSPLFMDQMTYAVCDLMSDAYPELIESRERVAKVVRREERQFQRTIGKGLDLLQQLVRSARYEAYRLALRQGPPETLIFIPEANVDAAARRFADGDILTEHDRQAFSQGFFGDRAPEMLKRIEEAKVTVEGNQAFKLYDTFGLPLDFIQDVVRDSGLNFDQAGFDRAMVDQRERARASWKGGSKQTVSSELRDIPPTLFEGYSQTQSCGCVIRGVFRLNAPVTRELNPGEEGEVILDHTPFYADSGGQVGDVGLFYDVDGNIVVADVFGCIMPVQGVRFHKVRARQHLEVGDIVTAVVDRDIREATMRNHTATHLLHAGLREVLGKHVKQAGSLVAPNHLRFDFSHFTGVEDEELQDIEDIINKEVLRNERVEIVENVPIDVAVNEYHAMALFGEKYGDKVRVIRIGDFSTELCGGTHTGATGEIGLIKILKEGSVSSGVRRIEAVTGEGSLMHFRMDHELEEAARQFVPAEAYGAAGMQAALLKVTAGGEPRPRSLKDALLHVIELRDKKINDLERKLRDAIGREAAARGTSDVRDIRGVKVLTTRLDNLDRPQMREMVDKFRTEIGSGVVVLGSASNGNVSLIVGVTKDLTSRIQAGKIIGLVAQKVGGKGGGRPDLAEAGGKDAAALDSALSEAYSVVESLLT